MIFNYVFVFERPKTAMLSWAAENVRLVWNPPPHPDPSRLDEWILSRGCASSQRTRPVPFFPEVQEELTRSWKAPFTARNRFCSPPPSPLSMVEPLCGTRASTRWSGLWPCNCVQQPLPLCGVIRVSHHGSVCSHQV